MSAPLPEDEARRLAALHALGVLDSDPEEEFDRLAAAAARLLDAPVAAISLIDAQRQWLKSSVGVELKEIPRDIAFCAHAIAQDDLLEIRDARRDERFRGNPLVLRAPHVCFYAGVPLRTSGGHNVGTLCVLDFKSRELSQAQRDNLRVLAEQTMYALEARQVARRLAQTERQLRRAADFNAMLAQSSEAIAVASDQQQLLQSICEIAVRRGGFALAYVAQPDAAGLFGFLASAGNDAHLRALRLSTDGNTVEGRSPAGWVWRNARPHYTSWNPDEEVLRSWNSRAHLRGAMKANATVPIVRDGAVWGVLAALHADADAFDPEMQGLMVELAANIARGLDRLRIRARERELLSMQRALLDNTLAGIVMVRERRVVGANQRFAQMMGYESPQDVEGLPGRGFFASDADFDRIGALYAQVGSRGAVTVMDMRLMRRDGREILCDGSLGLPSDGDGSMFVWTVQDVTERARLQRRLHYEALHDPLSELPNRRALEQHLQGALARARRRETALAVGILDLDDFKPVNDQFGHEAGDALLREFARRMRGLLRESDFLARMGGDEFVVVLEDLQQATLLRELDEIMRRLHVAVDTPFALAGGVLASVGMTMGLAMVPDDGMDADTLLRNADAALYQVKARKSARIRWWQLGPQGVVDDVHDSRPDPYGAHAAALLSEVAQHLEDATAHFVDAFYAAIPQDADARFVVDSLSGEELAAMRELHARHLRHLLGAAQTRDELAGRSERLGTKQALLGIEPPLLIRPMAAFRRSVVESLGSARIAAAGRREIVRIIEDRLQDDLQHELLGLTQTMRAYQQVLLAQAGVAGALWSDALRDLIEPIGALPGVLACEVMRPNASNQFAVEAASGPRAEEIAALLSDPRYASRLDPGEAAGRGPIALAWRGGRPQSVASYARDPRVAHWREPMLELGVRSLVALPVLDTQAKPSFVLAIYGAFPNQFESAWMTQTMQALQQHAARLWQFSRISMPGGIVPQQVANACRDRLFSDGLRMYVQPVVNLLDGSCLKVEALARLSMGDGRIVGPGAFLPILGDAELDHLFRSGMEQVCAQLRAWDRGGLRIDAALNLPPSTLLDPECTHWVREVLAKYDIDASRLTLELLESQQLDSAAQTRAIDALKSVGVRLAMDDLGAGYSSLQRLSVLPFDTIKIDQGLSATLRRQPLQTFGVIRAIVQLADDLGRVVIVEGVEDPGIAEAVRILGARWAQGYVFARPMPLSELPTWLESFAAAPPRQDITSVLGALAQHWLLAPGRALAGRHAARGAMLRYLRSSEMQGSEIHRYYTAAAPGTSSRADHERCTQWLLARLGQT